jgi:protein TonB
MAARAEIFLEAENWRQPLLWSTLLHTAFFGAVLGYALIYEGRSGEPWGGGGEGGGAMSATLVSSASIPLPGSEVPTKNVLATESKGLSQSLPRAQEKETEPEAVPIPAPDAKIKRETRTTSARKPPPEPPVENVVPFGQGGPVTGPYGVFNARGASGGFSFGGGGDFGSRYGWYVDVVRRKVSENWLKYEIDPNISSARRVYITFEILRNGQPANVQVEQSSGVPSLDVSAVRALQRIDTFGPLPNDYAANKVAVEFWFDYRR